MAFLNLGGVGNLTWVDPPDAGPRTTARCLAFDTGPANAPLNDLMRHGAGWPRTRDGALAAPGAVADGVLAAFLDASLFLPDAAQVAGPRTIYRPGRRLVAELSDADAAATLTAVIAALRWRAGWSIARRRRARCWSPAAGGTTRC